MTRVLITGSADGLGRLAAQSLLADGHEVVLHARNRERLTAVRDLVDRGAAAVVGDLADMEQTRAVADEVNELGRMDAVIHNAGVYSGPHVLAVNIVAPYLLTALIERPKRLVYLSSSEHRGGARRPDRHRLDQPDRALPRQQALRHHARRGSRPGVAGCHQQCGRPGMGAHQDGRAWRARRPAAWAPHSRVARHQRRAWGADVRRLLGPPAPHPAAPRRP